jgi:hypothetical protein
VVMCGALEPFTLFEPLGRSDPETMTTLQPTL